MASPHDVNSFLDALISVRPLPPGPEWQTIYELRDAAKARGEPIGLHGIRRRIVALEKQGLVERQHAPRRGIGNGVAVYYRLKNGKP